MFPPSVQSQELKLEQNDAKEKCTKHRAIAGLALATGDSSMSTVDFFECRKFTVPENMAIDDKDEETVETMPPETCTENRVMVGFKAFAANGAPQTRWNNPPTLLSVCHKLEKYQVHYNVCASVTVSSGPWIGRPHSTSPDWDTIFYCPPDTLAVGMTRELDGSAYKIMSLMCCLVTYIQ